MAKIRVSSLAKEFGMSSKELLDHLAEMKIPAKSASSALEDAYVSMVRKKLAPVLEARRAEIEAAKEAEEQAAAAEEAARAAAAEAERLAAERRREEERRLSQAAQAAEEAARAAAAEAERAAREKAEAEAREAELEAKRRAVPASDSGSRFRSLLDQIAQQEVVLKEKKEAETKRKAEADSPRGDRRGGKRSERRSEAPAPARTRRTNIAPQVPAGMDVPAPEKAGRGKKRRGGQDHEHGDHYSRMAREAEEYSRERVLEEARAAVEEASRESTGRRKKRKEKREREAAQLREEKKLEEALAQGVNPEDLDAVRVSQGVTVQELAEALDVPANDIIKRLFLLGTPLTMTQSMSDDLVELVADDLGRQIRIITPEEENSFSFYDDPADLKPRPPVVTVMGHVDHGKTSLLDAIRHTGVASHEAGGITQHIGASQVTINGRQITFVDTPGHEAFTAMRARGAQATDIAILVVAADDGVMPQTIEAINHAKAAGVQTIVAINKMDKVGADPERIKQQLTEYGLVTEEWGGDTIMVPVSAVTGQGVDQLLEMILLVAEVQDYRANPDRKARGIIIEARLDKGRGPVATVLVKTGTLRVGDTIVAGTAYGRVRAMVNDRGERVKEALPSDPVEVIGFNDVPEAGDIITAVDDDSLSRRVAEERKDKLRAALIKNQQKASLDDLFSQISAGQIKDLNLIIKADVQGSVEAVKQSLEKLSNDEVRVRCIHGGVGAITETDIMLASASNAIIIGFNVRPDNNVREIAEREKIDIRLYRVIYNAIEDVEKAMKGMLAPKFREVVLGSAQVRQVFKVTGAGTVAGCYVTDGKVMRNAQARLLRDSVVIHEGKVDSLKRFKDDAREVAAGYECGMGFENYNDIKEGDVIECFQMEEIEQ